MSRNTVFKYVAPAEAAGMERGGAPRSEQEWADCVREWFPELIDTRVRQAVGPVIEPHRRFIVGQREQGVTLAIHQRLVDDHWLACSESSLRRWVAANLPEEEVRRARVTVLRPEPPRPGQEAQVDYGKLGAWIDPSTAGGEGRRLTLAGAGTAVATGLILDRMNARTQAGSPLGEFLSTRRAQLTPAAIGLPDYGEQRRVPGLRREEVAQLAGVSLAYYTRLEQGVSLNASPQVLDALATALGLDEAERRHLHGLSGGGRKRARRRRRPVEQVTTAMRQLMDVFGDAPAILLGRGSDVLAWNRTGHALFAGHLDPEGPDLPGERPNTAKLVFLDAHTRELYDADWPRKARDVVGKLRAAVGEDPDDAQLASLIGELSMGSAQFAALWAEHRVRAWDLAEYRMRHPLVGTMDVLQHSLPVPRASGVRLVAVTAAPGSDSQAALQLLAHTAVPGAPEAGEAETPVATAAATPPLR